MSHNLKFMGVIAALCVGFLLGALVSLMHNGLLAGAVFGAGALISALVIAKVIRWADGNNVNRPEPSRYNGSPFNQEQ